MTPAPEPTPVAPRAGLALAVWTGLAAAAVRLGVLFGMERVSHQTTLSLVQGRLAQALPLTLLVSLLLGCLLAGGLLKASSLQGRTARGLLLATVSLAGAGALFLYWTGWWSGDPTRMVGTRTDRGLQAVRALAATALVFAVALPIATALLARFVRRGTGLLVTGLVLVLALPLAFRVGFSRPAAQIPVHELVLDLLGHGAWKTLAAREDEGPHAAILSPALEYRLHGADLPALVLPPPAAVAFDLEHLDGTARFSARAGVDESALDLFRERPGRHAVRFRVRLGTRLAFETRVELADVGEYRGTEWVEVGGDVTVGRGDRLVLETALIGPGGVEVVPPEPLAAGFGEPTLERLRRVPRTRSSPSRPNVVLVVMDTLRADRLSLYGYERPTSPRLDQWARRGLVFDAAYSTASWTWPSTASILTGLEPPEHGVLDPTSCYLATSCATLAEALQANGLTTAAWSANPLIVPDKNFDQGFETFDHGKASTRPTELVMPAALEWLESVGDTRFFLYLHVTDPHAPLDPLPEARERFAPDVPDDFDPRAIVEYSRGLLANKGHSKTGELRTDEYVPPADQKAISDLYDACVWSGDMWFGRLLDTLERTGLGDRTVVAFTSDHGEELFDHGLATHAQSVHVELTRIPLVLAGPGVPEGLRVQVPVSNRHLAPTLARLGGARLEGPADPVDLIDLAREPLAPGDVLYSTTRGWWNGRRLLSIFGLRRGEWVLHYAPEGAPWGAQPDGDGEWRLYDLDTDPEERSDRSAEQPELASELREAIRRRVAELEARRSTPRIEAGEATLEMLRGIGYVGEDE